jgi:apolipoprotein N-acyltransferase
MIQKFSSFFPRYAKTTAFFCGLIASRAFPPFYDLWCLILGLCGVWFLADNAQTKHKIAAIGYWFGFGFFSAGFYWVGNALLIEADTFGWLYPLTFLASGAFFGLFMILPFSLRALYRTPWRQVSAFAAVWVLMEWLRSFVLTGFPWNLLGTVLAFRLELIQTASVWGTYGLSFVVLFWTGSFYLLLCRSERRISAALVLLILPVLLFGYGWLRCSSDRAIRGDLTVRLVQPAIEQAMKWQGNALEENLGQYVTLSQQKGLDEVDFVVWGETAVPFDPQDSDLYRSWIASAAPKNGYLMTGVLRREADQVYNSLYILDPSGEIVDFYDKSHLVPFGEYIPLRAFLPDLIRPVAGRVSDLSVGTPYKALHVNNYPRLGALICYEIIFPDAVVNRSQKPEWLVVVSNDGWYGLSAGPYQHLVAAQMRALEEGITVVRSANTGISAVIDPYGKILDSVGLAKRGFVDVKLPKKLSIDTVYALIGSETIVSLLLLMLVLMYVLTGKRKLKNPLNESELRAFLEESVFRASFDDFYEMTRGGNSFNYVAKTPDGSYAVKLIFPNRKAAFERIRNILNFMNHCPEFNTVRCVFQTDLTFHDYGILITNFIEGRKIGYRELTPSVMQSVMDTYCCFQKLALSDEDFVLPCCTPKEMFEQNQKTIEKMKRSAKKSQAQVFQKLLDFNEYVYRKTPDLNAELSVLHGDASLNNMLYDFQKRVAFLDLEQMRYGYPVEDAAELICSALLPRYVFFVPTKQLKILIDAVNERTHWSSQVWQYGICLYFLNSLSRRLFGNKLFLSRRKTWLFMQHIKKFDTVYALVMKK